MAANQSDDVALTRLLRRLKGLGDKTVSKCTAGVSRGDLFAAIAEGDPSDTLSATATASVKELADMLRVFVKLKSQGELFTSGSELRLVIHLNLPCRVETVRSFCLSQPVRLVPHIQVYWRISVLQLV